MREAHIENATFIDEKTRALRAARFLKQFVNSCTEIFDSCRVSFLFLLFLGRMFAYFLQPGLSPRLVNMSYYIGTKRPKNSSYKYDWNSRFRIFNIWHLQLLLLFYL